MEIEVWFVVIEDETENEVEIVDEMENKVEAEDGD
jgi:hypothetical protein